MMSDKIIQAKKVAVISHNYNRLNRFGFQDFTEHFSQINMVCDRNGCDTILYALFSWDEQSPVQRTRKTIFDGLKNVESVIIEVGNKKSLRKVVEIWLNDEESPKMIEQFFARSNEPYERKRDFIHDIGHRVFGNTIIILCGESNIINFIPSNSTFRDDFGLNKILKVNDVKVILNPLHDYMTRYEMKKKRSYLSSERRAVITVWNQGKRKGEARVPWTFFRDGKDMTEQVREISPNIASRPDIRIGIIPDIL